VVVSSFRERADQPSVPRLTESGTLSVVRSLRNRSVLLLLFNRVTGTIHGRCPNVIVIRPSTERKVKAMYTTTRNIAGGTVMTCNDCGDAISMNKLCEKPLQSARDMLKHIARHNASRALASVAPVLPTGT